MKRSVGAISIRLATLVCLVASGCVTPQAETFPLPFQIIAHRGASAYAPENTIPAIEVARKLGAFEVELDVQLSKDQKVVVFHDVTLDQKTGRKGGTADHDLATLQRFEIGTWFDKTHPEMGKKGRRFKGTGLVSLAQVFERFGDDLFYHLELKSEDPQLPKRAYDVVAKAGLLSRTRFTSFSFDQLERIGSLDRTIGRTFLIRTAATLQKQAADPSIDLLTLQAKAIDRAAAAGFDQVGIAAVDLSREIVGYAAAMRIQVRAWRIQSDVDMRRAIAMGAHGMTTNWPDRLIPLLVRHMGSGGASH